MSHKIEVDEYVRRAERIAARNGGFLPSMSKLSDMGEISVLRALRVDRAPFEHILPKQGRGRDKSKYEYVRAHMDDDDGVIAKAVGVSRTTVGNWKHEIREAGFVRPDSSDPPADATVDDMAKFIVENLPEHWTLDMTFGNDGCYVTLFQPNGMRRDVEDAEGASLGRSVLTHVNYARSRSRMPPVGWSS